MKKLLIGLIFLSTISLGQVTPDGTIKSTTNSNIRISPLITGVNEAAIFDMLTNSKLSLITSPGYLPIGNVSGYFTGIPLSGDGNLSSSGVLSILKVNGVTFPSLTGNSGKFLTTDGTGLSWATASGGISLTSLSATTPLSYNNSTGVFSIQQSTTSQNGFVTNTDWSTFNNKANGLIKTSIKTSNYAASAGDLVMVDCSAANIIITLPSAPSDKTRIAIKLSNIAAPYYTTVVTSGSDVFNKPSGVTSAIMSIPSQAFNLQYDAGSLIWIFVGDDLPLGSADNRWSFKPTSNIVAGSPDALNRTDANSVQQLPNGNFLLVVQGYPGATFDASTAHIYASVSTDGKTWPRLTKILDNIGGNPVYIPSLDIRANGTVFMIVDCQPTTTTSQIWKVELTISGVSVSTGTQTKIYDGGGGEYYAPMADRIYKTTTGRLLYPFNRAITSDHTSQTGTFVGQILYSDDDGVTWAVQGTSGSNIINSPDGLCAEPGIFSEYNSNPAAAEALICYFRTRSGYVYVGRSTDNGVTWFAPSSGGTSIGLQAQNSTTTIKYDSTTRLYYAVGNPTVSSQNYRNVMYVATSPDNLNWNYVHLIDHNVKTWGYFFEPTIFFTNGVVNVLYSRATSATLAQINLYIHTWIPDYTSPLNVPQYNNIMVRRSFDIGAGDYLGLYNDGVSTASGYHRWSQQTGDGTKFGIWEQTRSLSVNWGHLKSVIHPANVLGMEIEFSTNGSTGALTNKVFQITNGQYGGGGTALFTLYPTTMVIPYGSTASRPATSGTGLLTGVLRYNTDNNNFEGYNGTSWLQHLAVPAGTYTTGAIPYASAANVVSWLNPGSNTQVLTLTGGVPVWASPASGGMTNPMTTAGDMIYGGAAGAPTRLAANSTGTNQFLTSVSSGNPTYATIAASDVSPVAFVLSGTSQSLTGPVNFIGTTTNTFKLEFDNLTTTETVGAGLLLQNTTAATAVITIQNAPLFTIRSSAWKTNATAASQNVDFSQTVIPVAGAAAPTGTWNLQYAINNAAPTTIFSVRAVDGTTTLGASGQNTQFVIAGTGTGAGIFSPSYNSGSANTISLKDFSSTPYMVLNMPSTFNTSLTLGVTAVPFATFGIAPHATTGANAIPALSVYGTDGTALTVGELHDAVFNFGINGSGSARTFQWNTTSMTNERSVQWFGPTYTGTGGAVTVTNTSFMDITPSIAGTNYTSTVGYGLRILSANVGSGITTQYGLEVNASTGATTNYALHINGVESYVSNTLLGTIAAGTREYNNAHYITSNALNRVGAGGSIADFVSDVGNSGSSETDLFTYTTKANTLAATGEKLTFTISGNIVGSATASRTINLYFAGTNIGAVTGATISTSGSFKATVEIIRTGSTTARASVSFSVDNLTLTNTVTESDLTSLTFSSTNIVKITGTSSGTGSASNDIVAKLGWINWFPSSNN